MRSYDVFFFGAFFFLLGVLLASIGVKAGVLWLTLALVVLCTAAARFAERFPHRIAARISRNGWFAMAALTLLLPCGALYYVHDDMIFRNARLPAGKTEFSGTVTNDPKASGSSQEAFVAIAAPYQGNVLVKLRAYPRVVYGDVLALTGTVEMASPESYARYLEKERLGGVVPFPVFSVTGYAGSTAKEFLYSVKHRMLGALQKALPAEEAAFVGGLILGARSEFSDAFKEAMQRSGTTHLVALSGYNITIVAWAAMGCLLWFFRRGWALALTTLVIIGFVLMTGAEASVVRAAIMGILLLIAREAGRGASIRNAVLAAALAMVLVNPKVLAWDVGFQLSFLAFLGIAYLRPALAALFRMSEDAGFLSWRDNLVTTVAAQLAVAPLLISSFGGVSLFSIFANMLVLGLVPFTMGAGFLVAAAGAVSEYIALVVGWFAWVLLQFEIGVIKLFGALYVPLAPNLSAALIALYYLAIVGFIAYVWYRNRMNVPLNQ